jgi:hypothetical protein
MSLRGLIQLGYTLPSDLVSGGPGWVDDTRYDVEAKAEGKASQYQRLAMLKTLLAERFKLTFHYVSLFMALKEIGLKLDTAKSLVQSLRIDHAERPSEN